MARDFVNRCSWKPADVLHLGSIYDVAAAVHRLFQLEAKMSACCLL
jgi:hypothetical protein